MTPPSSATCAGHLGLGRGVGMLRRKSPQGLTFTSIDQSGICRVVPAGTWRAGRFEDRKAGDRNPLASCRLPSVLALEIRPRSGRPKTPLEICQLIRKVSLANPLWGAPARGAHAIAQDANYVPWRRALCSAGGDDVVREQQHRLHLRSVRYQASRQKSRHGQRPRSTCSARITRRRTAVASAASSMSPISPRHIARRCSICAPAASRGR
jgi:hypothetical protein